MLDEQRVERDPVARVDALPQRLLGLFGGPGTDQPEPVRDTVDVRVDGDRRNAVAKDQDAVRRLRPDSRERKQLLHRGRYPAPPAGQDLPGTGAERPGLRPVEPGLSDQSLDGCDRGLRQRLGGGVAREQLRARAVGRLIPRALGEDRADEDLEGVLGVVPQVGDPPVPLAVQLAQSVENALPRELSRILHGVPPARRADGKTTPGSERSGSSSTSPSAARNNSPTR